MRNILYLFLILYASLGMISCEKGEKLTNYEELVSLQFNGLPNGTTIFRDGQRLTEKLNVFKVPVGEADYRFEDTEGNVIMEQHLDVTGPLSITVFDSGNGLLLVTPIDYVEVNPTKLKVDIANLSKFADSDKVNLAVYRMNLNLETVTEPTIIKGITSNFTDEFTEVDLGDLTTWENGDVMAIYLLDENMEPFRKDNLPVCFMMGVVNGDYNEMHKIYKVILKEEEYDGPLEGPFGAYPEGFYICTATVLISK